MRMTCVVLNGGSALLRLEVEDERNADGVGKRVAAETGSGDQIGQVELENGVAESETESQVLAATLGVAFVEIAGTSSKGMLVPVLATDGELELAQLFAEAAGGIVEGLDSPLDESAVTLN